MASRKIQSPNVEINEIDRSQYGKEDYSLPNSPTSLVVGFASKGEEYAFTWVNSKDTLDSTYGTPTTEFEKYFYNAACEILNRGGTCVGVRLPYSNASTDKYAYTRYKASLCATADTHLSALLSNDSNLLSCIDITLDNTDPIKTLEQFDNFLTHHESPLTNCIDIVDITRSQYGKLHSFDTSIISSAEDPYSNDFLGIVPVIVTPANALFFQNMLNFSDGTLSTDAVYFSQVSSLTTLENRQINRTGLDKLSSFLVMPMDSVLPVQSSDTSPNGILWTQQDSLSRRASSIFPIINTNYNGHFQPDNLMKIGIAVFKAYKDLDNNGKVNFQLLESFVGSLDKNARDPLTNSTTFIDNIVNASSQYIRVFSNIKQEILDKASIFTTSQQKAMSLGFYAIQCKKRISYDKSIMAPMSRILETASNRYALPIDLVIDAGMSTIAQIAAASEIGAIDTDAKPNIADYNAPISSNQGWIAFTRMLDNFVKVRRKDCMALIDGIRSFCLDGNMKIVRKTAPNNTMASSVLPNLKWMTNVIDSSYSAGYCDWFYQQDNSSEDFMWIPPSIKAAGVYIYCDTYFQPWSAPAGLTRGVINDVVDVAFSPNEEDAGKLYNAQWNYAISYPIDGIVLEGHKTFQAQKTALDRVNVRKLALYLEKRTAQIGHRFVYEQNTPYLRQRFVDALKVVYDDAVRRDGLRDYAIKCDDELNTAQVIENNELRCRIAIRPVKCLDFLVIDFIITRQSANVNEEVMR